MSGKRLNSADLCRFAYSDGRHCRTPAHPDFDGLCFQHGTFRPRASRQDNFRREVAPLADGSSRGADYRRAYDALNRALCDGRITPKQSALLNHISSIIRLGQRYIDEEEFAAGKGPHSDSIRRLIDGTSDAPDASPETRQ